MIQHYVIKFVSVLQQVSVFLQVLLFSPCHDITRILLKVASVYRQYMHIVGKYKIFVQDLETIRKMSPWQAFLSCFEASTN
jgi:hypothetical protein